jgi:hypothetical protein
MIRLANAPALSRSISAVYYWQEMWHSSITLPAIVHDQAFQIITRQMPIEIVLLSTTRGSGRKIYWLESSQYP